MSYALFNLSKAHGVAGYCIARSIHARCRIGCRDVVGHGVNGSASYKDDAHFPFPSVRFKENTKDICVCKYKISILSVPA